MADRTHYLQQMADLIDHLVDDGYTNEEFGEIFAAAMVHTDGPGEVPYARGTCIAYGAVHVAWRVPAGAAGARAVPELRQALVKEHTANSMHKYERPRSVPVRRSAAPGGSGQPSGSVSTPTSAAFEPPGLCRHLLTPPPDEGLNRHRGAFASVDPHKLVNCRFHSVNPVRGLRGRDHSAGVIVGRMSGVLKFSKCVDNLGTGAENSCRSWFR